MIEIRLYRQQTYKIQTVKMKHIIQTTTTRYFVQNSFCLYLAMLQFPALCIAMGLMLIEVDLALRESHQSHQ